MKRNVQAVVSLVIVLGLWIVPGAHAEFGIAPGTLAAVAEEEDGSLDLQASSHPFSYTVHFDLKTDEAGLSDGGQMRDILIEAPPGLVGNPQAVPKCSRSIFEAGADGCPSSTQVGVLRAQPGGLPQIVTPIYNIDPPPGAAVDFGVNARAALLTSQQYGSVRLENELGQPEYGVNVFAPSIPIEITSVTATLWGTPADPGHTPERGPDSRGGGFPSDAPLLPFLTLPADCSAPPAITVKVDSIEEPGVYVRESAPLRDEGGNPVSLVGCGSVPFAPSVTSSPSTAQADSPSGLAFELSLPNEGLMTPGGVTETEPEKTEVVLPRGVSINPAAANGIAGCSEEEFRRANGEPGRGCPDRSKVGTLVAKTPLLAEPIQGSVFLAQPHANKFGSLLAIYIVAGAKERGVLVKQAGLVAADPATGQLTTTFDGLPPLPYSSFEFSLRQGPRAPLITPQTCGGLTTVARLFSFSMPGTAVERTAPFRISSGANGAGCASSEADLPVHPTMEAGAVIPTAGGYSPFIFRVSRSDGEQRLSSISATLPTGLLGKLAGIPYCSEAGIAAASMRTGEGDGALEIASPSCPNASEVGIVNVSAGAGPSPYFVQGKVYLAGPYKGAPLSLEIITPAIAGPFDLGSVAVRTALSVDPITAQIHAASDPLPTILHGIPLDVRTVSLQMDKSQFTLNPTNCKAKTVVASVTTLVGQSAPLSNPFAVAGCSGLHFAPKLQLSLVGQTKRTGNPALKALLTVPKGNNANISGTTVVLPKGSFIDNAHINNPCTRVQFNSGKLPGEGCPANSILGTAKATSPLLDKALEGNVYFRSNGGERELPDLVAVLRGQIEVQLVGYVDAIGKKGSQVSRVRTRFSNVPDAPVSRFELKLSGGKKGLIENSSNLCKGKHFASLTLKGQNGKVEKMTSPVRSSCGK